MESQIMDALQRNPLPEGVKAYFGARLRLNLYEIIMRDLAPKLESGQITVEDVASKLGWSNRKTRATLGSPFGWKIETVSDLLLALSGSEVDPLAVKIGTPLRMDATPAQPREEPRDE
jgi:hypothetical protein